MLYRIILNFLNFDERNSLKKQKFGKRAKVTSNFVHFPKLSSYLHFHCCC